MARRPHHLVRGQEVKRFIFHGNKTRIIDAPTREAAKAEFMERYGYYPDESLIEERHIEGTV